MFRSTLLLLLLISSTVFANSVNSHVSDYSDYSIIESPYELKNKSYTAYKYYMDESKLSSRNYDTIYLMIAGSSNQSIGSFGGHTFLVLSQGEDLTNATAVNFYGEHETLNTFQKAAFGITKGLPGYIDIRPFSQIVERYTIGQDRTIFYYKLDFTKVEINRLIVRLYQLDDEIGNYQFLTNNCANIAIELFMAALDMDESFELPFLIIPSYLPTIMEKNNLILSKGIFSPPIARLAKENLQITYEEIKEKKAFYDLNLNETSFNDSSPVFIPEIDTIDYGTKLDSYMSQLQLGYNGSTPTIGVSLFSSNRYQQSQGPTQALQINYFDLSLEIDNSKIKFDSFLFFDYNSYPKINYNRKLTKKLSLKSLNNSDGDFQTILTGGFGMAAGNSNILFDVTSDFEFGLVHFGMKLSINSEIIFYNKNAFLLVAANYPFYVFEYESDKSLITAAGLSLFDRVDLKGSYNWIGNDFEVGFIWNYNPFYFKGY